MQIRIQNNSRETQIFHLTHEECCTETECYCPRVRVGTTEHDPKTGNVTQHIRPRRIARTITLQPKGCEADSVEVPLEWGYAPDLVSARTKGVVQIKEVAPKPEEATEAAPPATPETTPDAPPPQEAQAEEPKTPAAEATPTPPNENSGRKAKSKE